MKRSILYFLVLGLCLLFFNPATQAQTLNYRIIWKGDSVGFLSADVEKKNETIHYKIISEASFWALKRFNLANFFESIQRDTIVTFAKTTYHINEKLKSSSTIYKNGSGYDVTIDGETTKEPTQIISRTITSVYHSPPTFSTKVFSERFGVFCSWKKLNADMYELTKPDGRTNIYEYKNGVCQKVKVNSRFATFYFELLD